MTESINGSNLSTEKAALLANLRYLKSLTVNEYTFHKKCDELEDKFYTYRDDVHTAQNRLWAPNNILDEALTVANIENLRPKVIIADDDELKDYWEIFRLFVSTGEYNQTPGRFIKFIVVDTNLTEDRKPNQIETILKSRGVVPWPVLGLGAVSSDFPSITCRDDVIGWTKDQRLGGKLNNTAIGSTIIPTQPFGFNFLGGKLIAALITTKIIRNDWQLQYGDVLAGMTTTSLFGLPSMYDRLPWWKRLGLSTGNVLIQPDAQIYKKWVKYIKGAEAEEFDKLTKKNSPEDSGVSFIKSKILNLIYQTAGISVEEFKHGFERGVYFSSFYENTNDFLCDKISDSELKLKPLFQGDVNSIMEWWRPRAIKRYRQLKTENKLKADTQFYNHLGRMDYETAKEAFFGDVGR